MSSSAPAPPARFYLSSAPLRGYPTPTRASLYLLLYVLTSLCVWRPSAACAEEEEQPRVRRATRLTEEAQRTRISKLVSDGDKEALMLTLDRAAELLTRDLSAALSAGRSPIAIKGVGVRAPLSSNLADWLEARVSALLHQAGQRVVFCVSCRAQQSALTEDAWRLKHGLSSPEDIKRAAEASGARSLVDLLVGWDAERNKLALRARLYSAEGDVLWSQDYLTDSEAQVERVAAKGSPQGSSEGHYQALATMYDLEDSDSVLSVTGGAGSVPSASGGPSFTALDLGVGWGERFGDTLKYRYALSLNFSVGTRGQTFITQLGGEWMGRLSAPPKPEPDSADTRGFWLGGGASLNYVFIRQGVGLYALGDWVSSLGLGLRLKLGYQLGFGAAPPDLSGPYGILSALFLM